MATGVYVDNVWEIDKLNNSSKEKLGYPTQKPEALLTRVPEASSVRIDFLFEVGRDVAPRPAATQMEQDLLYAAQMAPANATRYTPPAVDSIEQLAEPGDLLMGKHAAKSGVETPEN